VVVTELELDLSGVLPLAAAEQQAAVVGAPLDLHVAVRQQLLALAEPLHLHGLVALEGQLEDGVLPHLDDHGLAEHAHVLLVKPRGVCGRNDTLGIDERYEDRTASVHELYSTVENIDFSASDMEMY